MSTKRLNTAAFCALGLVLLPHIAQAQAVPGGAIEDRTRQQVRLPTEEEREEALLTGDTDIVLTRRTRLFTVHGDVETVLTNNAYLVETAPVTDSYAQAQVGLGFGTRIGGTVDVLADASLIRVAYSDETALDYAAFAGLLGARASIGSVQISATWQPVVVFDRDFQDRQLTTHRLGLSVSIPHRLGPALIEPSLHLERTIADPADYDAWSVGTNLALGVPLSQRLPLLGYASAGYERREFDSYFPGLVGLDRKDDSISASLGVVWRPRAWGELRLAYAFQRNWSTSDVNRYQAHSGRLGLSARIRF
jgi:hypothetical protein